MGQLLPSPIIVEVTDDRGQQLKGATVQFVFASAGSGAEIIPSTATTDFQGRAQARVVLGDKVGLQVGEARVASLKTTFSAVASSPGPGKSGPRANFSWQCQNLACQFIDGSTDNDGTLTSWAWLFGDGTMSTERQPAHTYSKAGTYSVTLSVTDNDGSSNASSTQVSVSVPPPSQSNKSPEAEFDVSCQELTCSFTDRSSDSDGSIASWRWDFGDGASSTQRSLSHSYARAGQYTVVLTVTDNGGATNAKTHQANPSAPPPPSNKPPQAEFGVACRDLTCAFTDRSKDDDGSIVNWRWDFGDGRTSNERNPSHSYATPGRYTIVLTVTDNDGAADTQTHEADAAAPLPPPANKPPVAEFETHCHHETCAFTDKSKDDDGTIVSWRWTFGDGATSEERNPVHTYADRGKYDVSLTVTDNSGASGTRTHTADVKD